MASEPKEMKYRRRSSRAPEPSEYGQCGDRRSGALDSGQLKQLLVGVGGLGDPAELLRKLDEIRDQITRSCELGAGQPPPERRRVTSRRAVSLRTSHAAEEGPGTEHHYHRSHFVGRYGNGPSLMPPPSAYDHHHQVPRAVPDERYARQPSGRFRQYAEGQRESYGFGQGSRHHSACQCAQCLRGQWAVPPPPPPPPEEHIPMARYFAGQQQQQGSFRYDRSQPISSELDRRSVASSLYSHLSMSKRRMEYFRKKAESFVRPIRGAAPFLVCSSCSHLLQLPQGKFTGPRKTQVQCGSCSEIITFRPKEVKVHPVILPSSFPASKGVRSSNHWDPKSSGWYQHQDDDNFNFYKLQAHGSYRQKKDSADSMSPSSTSSYDRTDSERGSNRSIQLKPVPASRSRFANNPKDILCQGDTDSLVEAAAPCTISSRGPILEDKQIDPFSSQRKDYSAGDQTRSKEYDVDGKADYEANGRDESTGMKCIQKSKEGHKVGHEYISRRTHGQKGRHGNIGSPEDGTVGNKYKSNSVNLDDEDTSIKYENNGSFSVQGISNRDENCNKKDENSSLETDRTITKRCEQENIKNDSGKLFRSESKNGNTLAMNGPSVNGRSNSSSNVSGEAEVDGLQPSTGKNGDSSFFTGFLKKGFKDLSLFNQSVDSTKVSINGHPISERALRKAEKKAGPVGPGSYWYDYRAGFWGVFGQECSGIIPPFIKEFNYPMPKDCAGGNTGVFVNGRELHQKDFDLLVGRGLPRMSGKSYSVDISGSVTDDTTGKKLRGLGKLAPTIEKMKRGFGMHIPGETS